MAATGGRDTLRTADGRRGAVAERLTQTGYWAADAVMPATSARTLSRSPVFEAATLPVIAASPTSPAFRTFPTR
jgi:hypothetical protein